MCTGSLNQTWVPVQIGHEHGYMMSAFLSDRLTEAYPLNEKKAGTVHTDSWVNLRSAPSTKSYGLMQLREGDQVIIMGETGSHWYYVSFNGLAGYVKSDYVKRGTAPYPHDHITPDMVNVIAGKESFWHTGAEAYMYLHDVGSLCYDGLEVTFPRFAIADVDHDTNDEIILAQTVGKDEYYGYLILKSADSAVWGYEVFYRAMLSLKADGTFSFSSGAADNGFGYLNPKGHQFDLGEIAASESSDENIAYRLNGEAVSHAVYQAADDGQAQKPDAIWYALTQENLDAVLDVIRD